VRRLVVQAKDLPHGAQAWALFMGIKAQALDLTIPSHAVWTTPPPSWKRRLAHWYLPNFLAAQLAEYHQQPFRQLLERQRRTQNQGDLDGAERRANLQNVFTARRSWLRCRSWPKSTVPQCVVLFDDVSTTGTTLVEAAKALRVMGVQEVHGVSVAMVP
jgi:predicted amidophosphoribosyltransferase